MVPINLFSFMVLFTLPRLRKSSGQFRNLKRGPNSTGVPNLLVIRKGEMVVAEGMYAVQEASVRRACARLPDDEWRAVSPESFVGAPIHPPPCARARERDTACTRLRCQKIR